MCAAILTGCGSWPEVDTPVGAHSGAWPKLLPINEVSALSGNEGDAQAQAQSLSQRAAALRARAAVMRRAVPDNAAMEALRARLAR